MRSKDGGSTKTPPQARHSSSSTPPTFTGARSRRHSGQGRAGRGSAAARETSAPQDEQCFAPWKIAAKHEGQATSARAVWQYGQERISGATGAPQDGQRNVPGVVAATRR